MDRGPEELQGALQAATGPLLERLTETREVSDVTRVACFVAFSHSNPTFNFR